MPVFDKNMRVKSVSSRFSTFHTITLIFLLFSSITLLLLPIKECSAQQYAFHTYSEDLVPNIGIHHGMIQDSRGIIWIWGSLGVIKYDGSLFQHITKQNGLGSDYVYQIEEAPSGKIYISNFTGISTYDPLTDNISPLELQLIEPIRVLEFLDETLLVGTDAGLDLVRGKAQYGFELFRRDGSEFATMPTDIIFDREENIIWVSTDRSGVLSFDYNIALQLFKMKNPDLQIELERIGNKEFEKIHPNVIDNPEYYLIDDPETRKRMFASLITEYRSNDKIAENVLSGLVLLPGTSRPITYLPGQIFEVGEKRLLPVSSQFEPYSNKMIKMGTTSNNELYFITSSSVCLFEDESILRFDQNSGLLNGRISLFMKDKQGIYWIVLEDGTVSRLLTTEIIQFSYLTHPYISNIEQALQLKDGGVLLIADSGFSIYKDGTLTPLLLPPHIPTKVLDVTYDSKDNILIVSKNCLYHYDFDKNKIIQLIKEQDTHQGETNFSTNSNGDVSVALSGKLYLWNGIKLISHPHDFETILLYPIMLYTPNDTTTYVAAWDGLARIKGKEKRYYRFNSIFATKDSINTIFNRNSYQQDPPYRIIPEGILESNIAAHCGITGPDSAMWVGTFASGIVRIDDDSVRTFDNKYGIPDDQYQSIHVDDNNNLYFIGPHNVVKVTKDTVSKVDINIPVEATLRTIKNLPEGSWSYGTSKGLIIKGENSECVLNRSFGLNESGVNDLVKTNEDELIVIQSNGFYVIPNNNSFLSTAKRYDPIVLSLSTDFGNSKCDSLIRLPLGKRTIGITYALTDFFNESENQFAWWLEGLYEDYVDHGTKSDVIFYRVPPGKYTFHLKSLNGLGQESSLRTPITIIVPPHIWETIKFKIFIVILAVTSIFLFIRWRMNRIKSANIRLEKAVRTRTSELQDALIMLEESQKHRIEAEKLGTAQEMAASIAHEFNNPLAIILGTYEIYKNKIKENLDPETNEKLESIPTNIRRMAELVKKLLSITSVKETEYAQGLKMIDLDQSSTFEKETNDLDADSK